MVGKKLSFFVLALVAATALTACDEGSSISVPEETGGNLSVRLAGLGECQQTLLAGDDWNDEQLVVSVMDGKLYFTHESAMFNCCIDSVTLSVELNGTEIVVTETEHCASPCDCICPLDVQGEILDLEAGTYSLSVCNTTGAVRCEVSEVSIN